MNVSAEAAVALPTRLRPTPDQVCSWYAHTLAALGAEVEHVGPDQIEFTLPWSRSFFDASLETSLAPLAGGHLEVTETSDGFEVSIAARSRNWVSYLPLVVFLATTGGLAAVGSPIGILPAASGLSLLAFTWARTISSLNRFLSSTNNAISDSFAAIPPPPHHLPAPLPRC